MTVFERVVAVGCCEEATWGGGGHSEGGEAAVDEGVFELTRCCWLCFTAVGYVSLLLALYDSLCVLFELTCCCLN